MILSTHAVVGAAVASLIPSHPTVAFAAGFASHFLIDAIPHWDYPLRSISVQPGARNSARVTLELITDLSFIALDAIAGLIRALLIFGTPASLPAVLLGAIGGMLPDPLQFVHTLWPREPLATLQRFHRWIHAKRRLYGLSGIISQIAFAAGAAVVASAIAGLIC